MQKLDGKILKAMIISGANNLVNNKKMVDDLNVFPVPDGDTGTNMSMSISAASNELLASEETSCAKVASIVASASLRGARGNSGVILSQLFRGFHRGLEDKSEVTIIELANAIKNASNTAFKAVMKPTEGTILTVARETADFAVSYSKDCTDILDFCENVLKTANETLNKTPEMLPVLKQAGVVDAGGMGLCKVLEGAYLALKGEDVKANEQVATVSKSTVNKTDIDTADIKFMYCTEFLINKKSANYSILSFRESISKKGDCMLVIDDDDVVKVHIHTNNPGYVLEQAVKIGELINIKIDNMKYQHNETIPEEEEAPSEPPKKFGIVAVANGDGIEEILKEIGTDGIVKGGQSMNPSASDILDVVNQVNAETIFIFPNNKNIIMAAQQVHELTDKNVVVIPTKTIPQGLSAILAFDENATAEDNETTMTEVASGVKTGSITFASRDSEMDGMDIKKDDIMGMEEGKITELGSDYNEVAAKIVDNISDDSTAVISVFYGEDVSEEKAKELEEKLKEKYPRCDVLVYFGGQPIYYYILYVE